MKACRRWRVLCPSRWSISLASPHERHRNEGCAQTQTNLFVRTVDESDLVFWRTANSPLSPIINTYEWLTKTRYVLPQVSKMDGISDGGGLSALFTGVMRANGIPRGCSSWRWAVFGSSPANARSGDHGRAAYDEGGILWCVFDFAGCWWMDQARLADPNNENTFLRPRPLRLLVPFILDEDRILTSSSPVQAGRGSDVAASRYSVAWPAETVRAVASG